MQDYFDQVAKRIVESLESNPILLPPEVPKIVNHAYLTTLALASKPLKQLADPDQLPSVIADKLIRGIILSTKESGYFDRKYGSALLDDNPIHWYLIFNKGFSEDREFWTLFFCRAMMLIANAEDEIEKNVSGATELIIEANMALDAGIWASEKSHSKIMDSYAIHVDQNYSQAMSGVDRKRQTDSERKKLLDSLVEKVEQRCIEFKEAGVLDKTDMKFHCTEVCRLAGTKNVKRLQNRCSELGLGKKFFPSRRRAKS